MPIKAMAALEKKTRVGVQVCTVHGARCAKYPDHPVLVERAKLTRDDLELAEMLYGGRLKIKLDQLRQAGHELPEEFDRGAEDRATVDRVALFFEAYDLDRHFPKDRDSEPSPCKPRKLSDDEIRERNEWAREAQAAYAKGRPAPTPPWERLRERELVLAIEIYKRDHSGEYDRESKAQVKALAEDDELRQKLAGALTTWVNTPRRHSAHQQEVREGYGDAVPNFEEME
ncbi:hypothetical protein [Streptomyces erythrochromogenes]|uniref:hypothetical protein n=1 Tax=Streptomyces erythrochromogenes TaxID=285574 RepID=UPI0036FAA37D